MDGNSELYSQESASAKKTKQEDQQSERRERSSSPNEFIYLPTAQHTEQQKWQQSRHHDSTRIKVSAIRENLRLLAALLLLLPCIITWSITKSEHLLFCIWGGWLGEKKYISGLGKEEIPHIEFWMLSYHILVREFFFGEDKINCTQLCTLPGYEFVHIIGL